MSILEDLWYGNLSPNERTIQKNSEYARLSKESLQCEEQFIKDLSAEGRQAYEDHTTKQMTLSSIAECDSFVSGFRLGARMMLEIFQTQNSQLPPINYQ